MTRYSLTWPKPKSVKDPVIPVNPKYGDYTPSSKVDVFAKPAITKADDTKIVVTRESALDKVINSDLSTESRQEFFKIFPSPNNKFGVDDVRYVASKIYPDMDLTNVPKNEIEKIISVKDLTKRDQSLSKSHILSI